MSLPFLLEIGAEEIPDWMIEPALAFLRERFTAILNEHRIGGVVSAVDATPRRLVLRATGLLEAQPEERREVSGPPVSAGAGAVAGYAKKMGIGPDELTKIQTAKGEYWSYSQRVPGRRSADVLAEALPPLITGVPFPKTMYWTGRNGPRFIRPIRWLLALLGSDIVPFEIAGVRSDNVTSGHRLLGAARISVTIENYETELERNGVILSAEQRRKRIADGLGPGVQADDALLKTLVYLTEYPTPIRGQFDASYLSLPREILVTVMRHHQRYFSVVEPDGTLAPEFVAVMNTNADPEGLVQRGNERVLRARFNDARFFWDMDLHRPLPERIGDLRAVTFQAKLGSYYDKVERMVTLAKQIALAARANTSLVVRAVQLCKCDLTTEMVKEFTELQGVVGGLYTRHTGEPTEVATAIYEHYKPLSMEDSIPSTLTGQVVSLADKCDTLRGCFDIGMLPTGSRDPFALRRAAQGIVRVLVEAKLRLKLSTLLGDNQQLREFITDRIRYYFRDIRGFNYDEVNAVIAADSDDLVDMDQRLAAIREVRPTENFEGLAVSFKRIQNILRQANFKPNGAVDAALLEPGPEAELHGEFLRLVDAVYAHRRAGDYAAALASIASIRPRIDMFFDKVLVNAPEERVRQNRLTLLSSLLHEFSTIADFSEIVVTTQ